MKPIFLMLTMLSPFVMNVSARGETQEVSPVNCEPSGQMGTEFHEVQHRGSVVLDCTGVTYLLCESSVVCCSLSMSALDTRIDSDKCAVVEWLNPAD